jgi:hypothetical protein
MELFTQFWDKLLKVLPVSPFLKFFDYFEDLPALGYLNWFFPVKDCLFVMAAYLVAVGVYYGFSVIMRWIRAIQ